MEGKRRYRLLDFLRGVSLVNMVAYHLLYDLVYLFGVRIEWYHGAGAYWWQQLICGSFILFAGASCRLSRNNLKRGAQLLAFGVVLGRVTAFGMPQQQVRFGILHFMGIACLLAGLLRPVLERVMPACGALVALFFFLLTRGVAGLPGTGVLFQRLLSPAALVFPLPVGFLPLAHGAGDGCAGMAPAAKPHLLGRAAHGLDLPGPPAGAVWDLLDAICPKKCWKFVPFFCIKLG